MRQLVLDTETTGLDAAGGHRIIEIGCVELVNRKFTGNNYHQYVNPERQIDDAAIEVHGITLDRLKDEPKFADIADDLIDYLRGAELVIHNAPFDVGFLNVEFKRAKTPKAVIADACSVLDSLAVARDMHPGQKNSLDALCKRYYIDNTQRTLHGALLDAEILADVYLAMTGGQTSLLGDGSSDEDNERAAALRNKSRKSRGPLPVIAASASEMSAHSEWLDFLEKENGQIPLWRTMGQSQ